MGVKAIPSNLQQFPQAIAIRNPTTEESFMLSKAQGKYFFCSEDKHLELVKAKTLIS
jgi:hypothetical protein